MPDIKKGNILVVAFLVTGTSIGSGLLALPICIGLAGIIPGIMVITIACVFMCLTGLVLANCVSNAKNIEFDLPSIYESLLGNGFKWVAIVANLIVLYGLIVAYLSCLTAIAETTLDMRQPFTPLIIFAVITIMNLFAIKIISRGNAFLVIILFISFVLLVIFTGTHVKTQNLQHLSWIFIPLSLPVLVNSFNFHNIIPVSCRILNFNKKRIYAAIILGISFSFIINAIWCIVVLGALHYSDHTNCNILYAFKNNLPATVPLGRLFLSMPFNIIAVIFALVAIITSYWTVGLSLTSFIGDLSRRYLRINIRVLDLVLAFTPPLLITLICPNIFISVQGIIGGIGIAVLFGLLPSIIFLRKLAGIKKILPLLMITFFAVVIALATLHKAGILTYFPK